MGRIGFFLHLPHTSGVDIHFFLDFFVVSINSLNLVIYLAAIACEVCSINGKANFAVHIAVNRTGQIQADYIHGAAVCVRCSVRVMPRYNIRPRLQVILIYLPNVVFALRKRLHFGASWVRERAAVEVVGGDGCGEVRRAVGQADGVGIVQAAALHMADVVAGIIVEYYLIRTVLNYGGLLRRLVIRRHIAIEFLLVACYLCAKQSFTCYVFCGFDILVVVGRIDITNRVRIFYPIIVHVQLKAFCGQYARSKSRMVRMRICRSRIIGKSGYVDYFGRIRCSNISDL